MALFREAQRTVWYHDGVIDIWVEPKDDLTLRLVTPLKNPRPLEQKGKQQWQSQDSQSRFTILTSWESSLREPESGTIEIQPQGRIRIIVEDLDTFHNGGAYVVNYFGEKMTKDFMEPLEAFLVQ
eukprot:CAMPEP_0116834040 /NCGR_PEP_ID=MMETSP0418-20121206/6772_1 /TAXON_ID=1158023 /ORGANISM="Astrosyne radiata, Strain 13vi08-1A" /LENGTH=124 /DNA_ID=CAMNT_0004463559 /DNA_START=163 /DNA_END=537 /DNA_ORIENTATION=+